MPIHKLTQRKIDAFIRAGKPGRLGDGGGLVLDLTKHGTACWLFRYTHEGRSRHIGLGGLRTVHLDDAREPARQRRLEALSGARLLSRRGGSKGISFEWCFREYWTGRKMQIDAKTRAIMESRMIRFALPVLGAMRV